MSQNSLKEGIGMTDAPEFPQADPAVQYIVRQVAKIEDARACTAGYYKGQTALMRRLEKTDEELAKIHRLLEGLTPEDAARYFREGMDHAIREVEGEVRREIQKGADDAVARLAATSRNLELTAADVERQMERVQKNMAGSEGLLRSAVRQAAGEYAEPSPRGSKGSQQPRPISRPGSRPWSRSASTECRWRISSGWWGWPSPSASWSGEWSEYGRPPIARPILTCFCCTCRPLGQLFGNP